MGSGVPGRLQGSHVPHHPEHASPVRTDLPHAGAGAVRGVRHARETGCDASERTDGSCHTGEESSRRDRAAG